MRRRLLRALCLGGALFAFAAPGRTQPLLTPDYTQDFTGDAETVPAGWAAHSDGSAAYAYLSGTGTMVLGKSTTEAGTQAAAFLRGARIPSKTGSSPTRSSKPF